MVNLFRLVSLIIFLLFSQFSFATLYYIEGQPNIKYQTPILACDGLASIYKAYNQHVSNGYCVYTLSGTAPDSGVLYIYPIADCVAPQVFDPKTQSCTVPTVSHCDETLASFYLGTNITVDEATSDKKSVCFDGCVYNLQNNSLSVGTKDTSGAWQFNEKIGAPTGSLCSGSNSSAVPVPTASLTPAQKCKQQGKSYGTVNGVVVCFATGTFGSADVKTKPTDKTVTNPSGITSSSTSNIINNNGSVTSTTTTTNTNSSTGAVTSATETKQQDKQSFCEENPNLTICKSSSFSGSCGAFSCDGDAIQCAIAKEQHQRDCALYDTHTSLSDKGQSMLDGTTGIANPADSSNREIKNITGIINEGSNIGSGAFEDLNIPLRGGGINLPFSKLNFIMNIFGTLLLAGAYINAGRIVGVR